MHLFVIYIGGAHKQSLIELHDIRFVVADSIEEAYPQLRQSWWGTPESLHLDAWGILDYADGHDINILKEPPQNTNNKLYFVNLGGYDQQQFTELHRNIFVVAEDVVQAKQRAVQQINDWESPHRDYLHSIDDVVEINPSLTNSSSNYYVHLQQAIEKKTFKFTCRYTPIGK